VTENLQRLTEHGELAVRPLLPEPAPPKLEITRAADDPTDELRDAIASVRDLPDESLEDAALRCGAPLSTIRDTHAAIDREDAPTPRDEPPRLGGSPNILERHKSIIDTFLDAAAASASNAGIAIAQMNPTDAALAKERLSYLRGTCAFVVQMIGVALAGNQDGANGLSD